MSINLQCCIVERARLHLPKSRSEILVAACTSRKSGDASTKASSNITQRRCAPIDSPCNCRATCPRLCAITRGQYCRAGSPNQYVYGDVTKY